MSTRLYNIPLLPDSIVSKKYEKTENVYYDPDQVQNFMKDAIRYTGSEPPLFESDTPRDNTMNATNRLTLMEHGRRYDHAPYHPEIFLGDTSQDVRGVATEPSLKKVADQNSFRFEQYHKKRFKNDNTHNVIEGVASEKHVSKLKANGVYHTASRLKIFDESMDTIVPRGKHNNGNTLNLYKDTFQQNDKYIGDSFEKVIPSFGGNKVSQLSNSVGAKWESLPDAKFKMSSFSNVYRTKMDVDNAISKVFKMATPETEYGTENGTIVSKSLLQLMDHIKQSKKLNQSVDAVSNMKFDSTVDSAATATNTLSINKGGAEILNTEQTQLRKDLEKYVSNVFNKEFSAKGAFTNRVETMDTGKDIKQSPLQSEVHNMTARLPNAEFNTIFQSILQDRKLDENTKLSFIRKISPELVDKIIKNIQSSKFTEHETKRIQQRDNDESNVSAVYQQTGIPNVHDYITNILKDDPKFYQSNPREIQVSNRKENTTIPFVQDTNNFRFDTEVTMDNHYLNRTTGPLGSKYLVSYQKQESDLNPMSEIPYYRSR